VHHIKNKDGKKFTNEDDAEEGICEESK